MRDSLNILCNEFIENRDVIKATFAWDSAYMFPVCASIFVDEKKKANQEELLRCRDILKENTGFFSSFRSTSKLAMISLMAVDENPEEKLAKALQVFALLKGKFWSSDFLPMAAMVIADMTEPERYAEVVDRTRVIYDLMKNEHPFLTSSEDSIFAVLLALSNLSEERIVEETERCYRILKQEFFSGNAVQSLSHVLALCEGIPESKCQRTMELYNGLRARGCRYGTDYELATLGLSAMLPVDKEQIIADIMDVDAFLCTQKGYGVFGIGRRQRLMHAGMIVTSDYMAGDKKHAMSSAAISGTISLIVAQEAAMCAAIAASSAAAASSS